MLKVGQVLYARYAGLIRREGGNPWSGQPDRGYVDWIDEGCGYVSINRCTYTLTPDLKGLSYKTFFSEE